MEETNILSCRCNRCGRCCNWRGGRHKTCRWSLYKEL